MKETRAVGILFALAIVLVWAGFTGRPGLVLAALVSPSALVEA